MVVNALIQSEG